LTIMVLMSVSATLLFSSEGADYYIKAKKAAGQGEIKQAVRLMKIAVENEPDNSEYLCYLGDMCGVMAQKASVFSKFSWAKKCKKAYIKAVEVNGNSVRARMSLMRFLVMAPGIAGGDDEEGARQAEAVLKLSPVMGKISFAFIANNDKKLNDAIRYINDSVNLLEKGEEFSARWYRRFAMKVIRNTGHNLGKKKFYDASDKVFAIGFSIFPEEFSLHHYMSVVAEKKGDKRKALKHMQKALELNKRRNLKEQKYFEYDSKAVNRLKKEVNV